MAWCYHDQEDFLSDMKIEIAKEDDIVKEGHDLDEFHCDKNPGHEGFIPFKDLKLEDLPESGRTMENFNTLKRRGNLIVRILVDKMENGKLKQFSGTGFVSKMFEKYCISTNNHVVGTDEDVEHCTVEFFYDSHDKSKVIKSRGVNLLATCPGRDRTVFEIHPVHDSIQQLHMPSYDRAMPDIVLCYNNIPFMTAPSCRSLKASVTLQFTGVNINDPQIEIMFLWNKSFSFLKSSYFRFQPIPSNIQDITNIEIHVDEDDGNSTVISGEVVKLDDEYVVKISESIFQDKVKKCRLVWNGEVISRGTRLYFQRMNSSELFSESDLFFEETMKDFPNYIWIFDFSPKDYLDMMDFEFESYSNMYCISHPHGCFKMVTFGLAFAISIIDMDTNERSKKTKCLNYSCKTCPGSSGSPVSRLDGLDYSVGPCHFMGRPVKRFLPNGQYIENINTAWIGGFDPSKD